MKLLAPLLNRRSARPAPHRTAASTVPDGHVCLPDPPPGLRRDAQAERVASHGAQLLFLLAAPPHPAAQPAGPHGLLQRCPERVTVGHGTG